MILFGFYIKLVSPFELAVHLHSALMACQNYLGFSPLLFKICFLLVMVKDSKGKAVIAQLTGYTLHT